QEQLPPHGSKIHQFIDYPTRPGNQRRIRARYLRRFSSERNFICPSRATLTEEKPQSYRLALRTEMTSLFQYCRRSHKEGASLVVTIWAVRPVSSLSQNGSWSCGL